MPRHRLEQIAARKRRARGLHRGLVFAGRVIGKSLPRRFGVNAFRGIARQAFGRLALPGEIVAQDHATAGCAVIGQQAIRHIEHDVALVFFARALLHEVLDLEHQIIGKRPEQAKQRIVTGAERRHEIAHQRHHAGAAGALVLVDRRSATHDMAGEPARGFVGYDDAGFAQGLAEEGDQHFAARVQRLQREIRSDGFELQRRVGKTEVKTLVTPRHRGAGRQHHAAAAIEQVDQVVQPVGAARKMLDRAGDRKPTMGAVFASGWE